MIIRNEYPRPEFKRAVWQTLNGLWDFEFDDTNSGIAKGFYKVSHLLSRKIVVPFAYQTEASGINETEDHPVMWYKKTFTLEEGLKGKNILLTFNAVDYSATVWVNGIYVGEHHNGYSRFSFNITKLLKQKGENVITVRVVDDVDANQPRGKQSWIGETHRCWYYATSGIWQSVWLEAVGEDYLVKTLIVPNIDKNNVLFTFETNGCASDIDVEISFKGEVVKKIKSTLDGKITKLTAELLPYDAIDEIHYWSPNHPNLYQVKLTLYMKNKVVDEVDTYFGFRKISLDGLGNILLNNRPLYQKLILDQGYWAKTGLTPPSHEALAHDIRLAKEMGFNGARKHQKIEDSYFYYYADKLGFLVWAEMPSGYQYDYKEVSKVSSQFYDLIIQLYNFPSIITWVPLNESWGVRKILVNKEQQALGKSLYYLAKAIDSTRLVNINDGWENPLLTDFISIHDYSRYGEDFAKESSKEGVVKAYPMGRKTIIGTEYNPTKPVLITEFGGISIREFMKKDNDWGYAGNEDLEGFYKRFKILMDNIKVSDIQGYCYTQLTDVMQETNGLLDANHNPKIDLKKIKDILNG